MPLLLRGLLAFALAAAALLLSAAVQAADAGEWTAVKVRGTVVYLVGDQWQEFSRSDAISDGRAVRTLQSGRLQLQREGESINLGPNTAVEILSREGSPTTVRQYSGSVTIKARKGQEHISIETPLLVASTADGVVSVVFDGATARVEVSGGSVSVVDRLLGNTAVLVAGQAVSNSASAGLRFSGGGIPPVALDAAGKPKAFASPGNRNDPSGDARNGGANEGDGTSEEHRDSNNGGGSSGGDGGSGGGAGNSGSGGNNGNAGGNGGGGGNSGNGGNNGNSGDGGNSGNGGKQ